MEELNLIDSGLIKKWIMVYEKFRRQQGEIFELFVKAKTIKDILIEDGRLKFVDIEVEKLNIMLRKIIHKNVQNSYYEILQYILKL